MEVASFGTHLCPANLDIRGPSGMIAQQIVGGAKSPFHLNPRPTWSPTPKKNAPDSKRVTGT